MHCHILQRLSATMDALLDRLWELANEEDEPRSARRFDRVNEARALWRALDVLVTLLKSQELVVGDGTFTKMLACIRSVLSDPSYWVTAPLTNSASDSSDDNSVTVFVCVNLVVLKVGGRGEQEREALVRDGVADLIVGCGESTDSYSLSAFEATAALQTLQLMVTDSLQVSHTIRMCISLMQKHETVFALQLRACQFLRQMALEEDCKERIGYRGGLQTVTKALGHFPEEVELVVTALDVLLFLCVELEYRDESIQTTPLRSANASDFYGIASAVVDAMRVLQSVERVQTNGVAVLNSIIMHSPVRKALCSLNIFDIAKNGLSTTATVAASFDFVELLDTLLRDPVTYEILRQMLCSVPPSLQDQRITKSRLKALKNQVETLRYSQVASKESTAHIAFVSTRLQSLLNEESCDITGEVSNHYKEQPVRTNGIDYDSHGKLFYLNSRLSMENDSGDELPVDSSGNLNYTNDTRGDDAGLILGGGSGYFEKFLQQPQYSSSTTVSSPCSSLASTAAEFGGLDKLDVLCKNPPDVRVCTKAHLISAYGKEQEPDSTSINSCRSTSNGDTQKMYALHEAKGSEANHPHSSSDKEAENWQALYEASAREVQRVENSFNELNARYHIVLRRSKEQAKLLALQNMRIINHGNEHQQILRRMRTLETSLDKADRRCQIEQTLRSAESLQCEQLSLALQESVREAKSLAALQSSAVRELQQTESLRTEYMIRTRENSEDKQRVELERDNAFIQIEILKQDKIKILQQLVDCRREGRETLQMREEDVDARRPGVFSELAKAATARKVVQQTGYAPQNGFTTTRRNSLPTETLSESTSSTPFSSPLHRSTSVYPTHTSTSAINEDFNDDPNAIDTSEIQNSLVAVFESLDTSIEGSDDASVHVSTVRRFFMESGLVQAPNVLPADVDVVLAGVLAQAQTNRKNSIVRKDFDGASQPPWTPPAGWAKTNRRASPTKSMSLAGDAKRYRFFSQDAFNEAVTLVSMRRFPRSDLLRVLQTVVALYLRPYLRQRQILSVPATIQRSRSSSTCSITRRPRSAGSPSQVCIRALKTILNGLALHLGHGNANQHLQNFRSTKINMGEVHCHLNPPSSINRAHKREDVVHSMLEMNAVLSREQRALGTICEYYSAQHLHNTAAATAISIAKIELFGLSFEILLNFAIDFDLIPSFMDRVSLKHLHTEVAGLVKAYFALHDKDMPTGADAETLKKVAFSMVLARFALELFSAKPGYETPEQQITGLLQWLDNSPGREKIMRKAGIPLVIRFSRQLYMVKIQ